MMDTVTAPPAYSPLGLPVTAMVTGKLALPPDDEEATIPTVLTVPKILVVLPVGVISTCRPFFSWGRSALPTLAWTTHAFVEITMIWALDEAAFPTLSPVAMLTCATVPARGDVIEAAARAVLASVSLL